MAQKEIKFIGFLANVDNSIMKVDFGSVFKMQKLSYNKAANLLLQLTHDTSPFGIIKKLTSDLGYYNNEKHRYCVTSSLKDNLKFNENDSITEWPSKLFPFHNKQVVKGLKQKLQLMRLFYDVNICIPFLYYYIDNADGVKIVMGAGSESFLGSDVKYKVHRGQKQKLQDFIDNTSLPFSHKYLQLAFESFEVSYHVSNLALAFLSLMIGLETMLNPGQGELRYRVSRNTAVLLDKKENVSEKVFGDIKDLYDKRSKLVHTGNNKEISKKDLLKLRKYVRDSIVKVYELSMDKVALCAALNKRGFA